MPSPSRETKVRLLGRGGGLDEKFASEFFCLYFIGSLHAITEHDEVVSKGVFAVYLLPDGLTGCNVKKCFLFVPDEKFSSVTMRWT